ncbi:MAG: nitroreductase family protein [Peptoniphilus sp.]|nr:nitroreductase family protein [Peptoniphilus sp.]MDD7363171.1 nitroreductase family protein [Bacillota bacterium]MDY6044505.1 nitroreductase family protein [Peptoniphilus sp.]
MELNEVIKKRRATRKYKQGETMDEETLLDILKQASMGPSKGNTHPVEFLIVEDEEKKERLAQIKKFGTKYLGEAPQIIVILGNNTEESTWVEETSIVASYLGLLLTDAGYQSSWVNIRDVKDNDGRPAEDVVRELFNIPAEYGILCLIPFGIADERLPKRRDFDISSKVHMGEF